MGALLVLGRDVNRIHREQPVRDVEPGVVDPVVVVPVRSRAHVVDVAVVLVLAGRRDVVGPAVEAGERRRAVVVRRRDGVFALEVVVRRRAAGAVGRQVVRLAHDQVRRDELLVPQLAPDVAPLEIRGDPE